MENENVQPDPKDLSLDLSKIDNAVIKRLIEEIKYCGKSGIDAYNRQHNRHNRSMSPRPMMPRED